jgi:hypothetical protein
MYSFFKLALDRDGWSKPRPGSLYLRIRHGTHCEVRWMCSRSVLDRCGKFASTGIPSPNRPARRESLYQLSYRRPRKIPQDTNISNQQRSKSRVKSRFLLKRMSLIKPQNFANSTNMVQLLSNASNFQYS